MALNNIEKSRLDAIDDEYQAITNMRVKRFLDEWPTFYPLLSLEILFGNGTECVEVDGKFIASYECKKYKPLLEFLEDIDEITEQYTKACPPDIHYTPKAKGA